MNQAVAEVQSRLEYVEMVGAVQTRRHGLGWSGHVWFSQTDR